MTAVNTNLLTRDDTFFGVCEAIGQDLGFHPNLLRLAFAVPLMFAPLWAIGVYAALAVVVLASRLLVPEPRTTVSPVEAERTPEPVVAANVEPEPLPLAA